jgi:hypothetical protein
MGLYGGLINQTDQTASFAAANHHHNHYPKNPRQITGFNSLEVHEVSQNINYDHLSGCEEEEGGEPEVQEGSMMQEESTQRSKVREQDIMTQFLQDFVFDTSNADHNKF